MAKITIDIEHIKESLASIGYEMTDCIERENNGTNWELKFSNSGAIVTVYDSNSKKNSVVNGRCSEVEKRELKLIVDGLKCKELTLDSLNQEIVNLVNLKREDAYYDYKQEWQKSGKDGDLLHDILCLANNTENRDAYLIIGVSDDYEVIGVSEWRKSNEIFDFLNNKKFAGEHVPEIELRKIYYQYHKLDVLLIKQSSNVPYFLEEKYKDVGIQIYTRVGDTNTPKNCSAAYRDIEKLWQIHFSK